MATERLVNCLNVQRAGNGLTQSALADLVGNTRKSISAIEMQRMMPSMSLALELARALETAVEQLFQLEKPRR